MENLAISVSTSQVNKINFFLKIAFYRNVHTISFFKTEVNLCQNPRKLETRLLEVTIAGEKADF